MAHLFSIIFVFVLWVVPGPNVSNGHKTMCSFFGWVLFHLRVLRAPGNTWVEREEDQVNWTLDRMEGHLCINHGRAVERKTGTNTSKPEVPGKKKDPPRPHSFSPIPFYLSNHPLNHAIFSPGRRLKLPKPHRPVEGSSPHLTSPASSSSCLASAPTLSVPGVLASTHAASATKPLATRAASSAVGAHNWRLSPTAIVDTAHPGDVRARTLHHHPTLPASSSNLTPTASRIHTNRWLPSTTQNPDCRHSRNKTHTK